MLSTVQYIYITDSSRNLDIGYYIFAYSIKYRYCSETKRNTTLIFSQIVYYDELRQN